LFFFIDIASHRMHMLPNLLLCQCQMQAKLLEARTLPDTHRGGL